MQVLYPPPSSLVIQRRHARTMVGVFVWSPALQDRGAVQRLAPQPRARLLRKDFASGADWGCRRGRPRQRYTETVEAAASLRKPAHRLSKRLAQNCAYVFRCFARNAMSGETFEQTTMSPSFTPAHQLRLVRSL